MNRVNTPKNKISQIFCKHRRQGWYKMESLYQCISGERRYLVCEDCGKVLANYFAEYEGMGFK